MRDGRLGDMEIVNTHQAEAWNSYEGKHWADNQDRYDAMYGGLNVPLFDAAGIDRRHRVLDIGCGAGQATRIAACNAADGHVAGIDLSAPMLDRARSTSVYEGLVNVTFERGDAQVYDFPAAHFDVAISRGGVMYFADPVAAFANIGGALKPGGRVAFVCGRDMGGGFEAVWAAMGEHVTLPDPTKDSEPGPATFTDPERIREVLTAAGFQDVALRPSVVEMVYGRDVADATEFIFGWGPVRYWLRDTDEASIGKAREAVTAALRAVEKPGAVATSGHIWVVSATWPGSRA